MITGPLKEAIRGVTTYERDLEVTGEDLKSTVILEVGAASISSRVFVNDKLCHELRCGFSMFRVDITGLLTIGCNKIRIEVSNAVDNTIYPAMADFSFYGGIYRDVDIIIDDALHFEEIGKGLDGIYVNPKVCGDEGELCADVFIKRESGYTGNAMEHLELLIDQVRNHTCVYCYGVQNEVCMVSKNEYTFNLVDRLSKKARELDPSCFTFENQICDIFENDEAKAVFIKYLKPITEGARFDPSSPITVNALLGFVKALNIPEPLLVSCEQELNKIKK